MQDSLFGVTDGATVGAWIQPRLGHEFGLVTRHVPKGYEAYGRIFHPACDRAGQLVRWAQVAEAMGAIAHREMQWEALIARSEWDGMAPSLGSMDLADLDALCEILGAYTEEPRHCYFGLCTILNWEESFSADELQSLLKLPMDRDHIVLAGPLTAVDQIIREYPSASASSGVWFAWKGDGPPLEHPRAEWKQRDAPNLIWPADHSWFVVSEVDFDSTLVGGSVELIKEIVESPKLEAWQVKPTDSLAYDADKINRPEGS